MPNHAVLAIEFPAVLELYESLYAATTLSYKTLSPRDKKLVQLAIVASSEIPLGGYHVRDFLEAGGSEAQVRAVMRIAMLVVGASPPDTVGPSWTAVPHLSYAEMFDDDFIRFALDSGLDAGVIELALVAGHACKRAWDRVAFHIVRAKARNVSDAALAEALTNLMLTAGNPIFVLACGVWHRLIREGKVDAQPAYRQAIELANA
jgi:alkylhydroperoxidase/carboxymuconolactone decarboxylase family protein YurZ